MIMTFFEELSSEAISCHFFLVDRSRAGEADKLFFSKRIAVNNAVHRVRPENTTDFERAVR